MKLYGFSTIRSFPCICWGRKGYFFKIIIGKDKRFHIYRGHTTAKDIISNNVNSNIFWFFGILINDETEGFLDYENYERL